MRHWLIGSGLSLLHTPLERLQSEITWGMNRIHRLYDRTAWRPTYYFMVDHNTTNPKGYWKECIEAHWDTPKWLWSAFRFGLPERHANYDDIPDGLDAPNTTWIERCEDHHYYQHGNSKAAQEWHLPRLCTGYTGMSTMIQLAVLNGATEIYLLGCDLYGSDYTENHFDADYTSDYRDRSETDNGNMIAAHEVAKRCSPVPIYNATLGGSLEVYPRVDMEEVLDGSHRR